MESWANNTLRVLGIVITSILVICVSIVLILFSLCAWGGDFSGAKHPDEAGVYLVACLGVLALGAVVSTKLAKGMNRAVAEDSLPLEAKSSVIPPRTHIAVHRSQASQNAIYALEAAILAEIGLSAFSWFSAMHKMRRITYFNPHYGAGPWWHPAAAGVLLNQLPYFVLLFFLFTKTDRRTSAYALATPIVGILISLFAFTPAFVRLSQNLEYFVRVLLGWAVQGLIFWLALRANKRLGIQPEPASLFVAGIVVFAYSYIAFFIIQPMAFRLL